MKRPWGKKQNGETQRCGNDAPWLTSAMASGILKRRDRCAVSRVKKIKPGQKMGREVCHEKVMLILIDGMRSDSLAGIEQVEKFVRE